MLRLVMALTVAYTDALVWELNKVIVLVLKGIPRVCLIRPLVSAS